MLSVAADSPLTEARFQVTKGLDDIRLYKTLALH